MDEQKFNELKVIAENNSALIEGKITEEEHKNRVNQKFNELKVIVENNLALMEGKITKEK